MTTNFLTRHINETGRYRFAFQRKDIETGIKHDTTGYALSEKHARARLDMWNNSSNNDFWVYTFLYSIEED